MKEITNEWLLAAKDDLKAAKTLLSDTSLTNLVAFHAQQCIEKSFKALAEENSLPIPKTHDLIRLHQLIKGLMADIDMEILYNVNELYIDARYPGEMGLMPNGKPSFTEAEVFVDFSALILFQIEGAISPP
jgi:HEPN domain-containing protein